MASLLLLTNDLLPSSEVLPALGLLSHQIRVMPAEATALLDAPACDAILVDGRRDLPAVRSFTRLLRTTGVDVPVLLVMTEGGLVGVNYAVSFLRTDGRRVRATPLDVVVDHILYLVERLGHSQARRLAVTGGRIAAQRALEIGLVHELHPDAELDAALAHTLHEILQNAPQAVAATKALIAKSRLHSPASLVQEAAEVFSRAALSVEGTEGQTAFLAKRKANWMPQ